MSITLDLGLALSGGGSRAAAFHRGTVRALDELGVIPRIKTLSSVSGGSVFAAAWMAARARKQSDQEFLKWIREVLVRGFIRPAVVNVRFLKLISPWFSRTDRIAETFDEILFDKLTWKDLPPSPLLCLNTTIVNNARTGRFSQTGYSGEGVGKRNGGSYPECDPGVSIGFATAASAAFPFGLPPLSIASDKFTPGVDPKLGKKLIFTDGGILENLGVERLLKSERFGTKHILVSDAAIQDLPWQPAGLIGKLRGGAIYALSAQILERLLSIMNNKQNATMRALLYAELEERTASPRRFMFVRLAQTWKVIKPEQDGPELAVAKKIYTEMGGDDAANKASTVATSFSGLSSSTLDLLEAHARWQTHAMIQLYAKDLLPGVSRSEVSGT